MNVTRHPSIRSRLTASFVAFGLGFVIANLGLLGVPRPDAWVWVAVALVLMGTGVLGVVFADARSRMSIWALLGVELFVAFTVLPLLWVLTLATASGDEVPTSLLPTSPSFGAFGEAVADGAIRAALGTTLLVAGLATLVAMVVALPAATVLVHGDLRGRRWWYAAFVVALVLPTFVLAAPWTAQLLDLGLARSPLATVVPTLALSVPFAVWLNVRVLRRAPWSLHQAMRAEGATGVQRLRHFVVPRLGLDLLAVAGLVFVWTAGDLALGAGLAPTDDLRPLPALLLARADDPTLVAAVGLWWAVPVVLVLGVVLSRRVVPLFGRP